MDERALQNIVDTFRDFKDAYVKAGPLKEITPLGDEPSVMFSKDGYFLHIRGEAFELYQTFLSKWERGDWKTKWSEGYRTDKVQSAIIKAWDANDGGAAVFVELEQELDSTPEVYTVWVPLSGIDFRIPELRIGSVRLIRMTPERSAKTLDAVKAISVTTLNDDKSKEIFLGFVEQTLNELANVTCAEVIASGNPDRAQEIAEESCLPAIDLLQFMVSLFVPSDDAIRVDFRSFDAMGFRPVLMLSQDKKHFRPSRNRFGAVGSFVIDNNTLQKLREWHFNGLFEILEKPEAERTEIEHLLLRAVHWFADAELQRNPENRLQGYVTCLDMFFSSKDGEATAAVQEGIAYIMGDDQEDRINLHKFIGEAYDYRSRASHTGERFQLPGLLNTLKGVTLDFIAEMLDRRDDFPSKKSIKQWVHAEKMR